MQEQPKMESISKPNPTLKANGKTSKSILLPVIEKISNLELLQSITLLRTHYNPLNSNIPLPKISEMSLSKSKHSYMESVSNQLINNKLGSHKTQQLFLVTLFTFPFLQSKGHPSFTKSPYQLLFITSTPQEYSMLMVLLTKTMWCLKLRSPSQDMESMN